MSDFLQPHGLQPARLLCLWGFFRQEYWSGLSCPPPGDLPNPWIEPRSPALQADSFLSKPPGKPKNIGVGSLSLLQGNFLTQKSNQGLLHCRQILYQLSYQGIIFRLSFFSGARQFSSVQYSCSVMSDSLRPHEPQHARPPSLSPTPGAHPNPCPLSQ